jgi:PAS domain S-box-containing protein
MIAPLAARGRILGAIAFASAESERVYGAEDLALAEELTDRAAMAVDNARLYVRVSAAEQDARRSHEQLRAILDGVADAVTAQDASGRLVYANDAAAELVGLASADELIDAPPERFAERYELLDEDGRTFPFDRLPGRRALAGEEPEPALVLYRDRQTGDRRWSLIKATAIRDDEGRPVLAINVVEDVTEHREREDEQRFLADTSGALASSLDVAETFPRVAALAAGQLGDWCAIAEVDPDGAVRTIAFGGAGTDADPAAEEMMRRYPLATPSRTYLAGAVGEGRSELVPELHEEELEAGARDPQHLALLRAIRPRSAMTVPMMVRGRLLGAVSVLTAHDGRRLDVDDLALAEELAGRCALALDNARLYEERSRIARTLQQSLLPPVLPELPGLDVAARFRAAGAGIEVGGDFYDLFDSGDGGWAVAIGDVCGKGSSAAAVTALARYTVRAAAMRPENPSRVLSLLNDALLRQDGDRRFCTVLFGRLARNGSGTAFEFASGGHPLPLLLRDGDGGRELGDPGTLLGVVPDPSLSDDRVTLGPGDALVLYTDGVTDAGAPARVLTAPELTASIGAPAGLGADEIAERMLRAALATIDGEPRDDIAIIVVKVPEAAAA